MWPFVLRLQTAVYKKTVCSAKWENKKLKVHSNEHIDAALISGETKTHTLFSLVLLVFISSHYRYKGQPEEVQSNIVYLYWVILGNIDKLY